MTDTIRQALAEAEAWKENSAKIQKEYGALLRDHHRYMDEKNATIDALQAQLAAKDTEISAKDAQIAERDATIAIMVDTLEGIRDYSHDPDASISAKECLQSLKEPNP